ncbi:MAG: hypothetical protein ACQESF_02055 [Nanobdellota archaeon]
MYDISPERMYQEYKKDNFGKLYTPKCENKYTCTDLNTIVDMAICGSSAENIESVNIIGSVLYKNFEGAFAKFKKTNNYSDIFKKILGFDKNNDIDVVIITKQPPKLNNIKYDLKRKICGYPTFTIMPQYSYKKHEGYSQNPKLNNDPQKIDFTYMSLFGFLNGLNEGNTMAKGVYEYSTPIIGKENFKIISDFVFNQKKDTRHFSEWEKGIDNLLNCYIE